MYFTFAFSLFRLALQGHLFTIGTELMKSSEEEVNFDGHFYTFGGFNVSIFIRRFSCWLQIWTLIVCLKQTADFVPVFFVCVCFSRELLANFPSTRHSGLNCGWFVHHHPAAQNNPESAENILRLDLNILQCWWSLNADVLNLRSRLINQVALYSCCFPQRIFSSTL